MILPEFTTVYSYYVRERNCLMVRGKFAPIYADYFLHLGKYGLRYAPQVDVLLRDMLAYFTLYLCTRPITEEHAWTLNLCDPVGANFFLTGATLEQRVVARAFTEEIKIPEKNMLHATLLHTHQRQAEPRSSVVPLGQNTPVVWMEDYFTHSEQRVAACFELADEEFVLITAQPTADTEWLRALSTEQVQTIMEQEVTTLLEQRDYKFQCGCTLERILPTLQAMCENVLEMFDGDESLEIACPRCGAVYEVTRELL